jgi:hypothetical protein
MPTRRQELSWSETRENKVDDTDDNASLLDGFLFDIEQMKRDLNSDDQMQLTVRAHLYVEHILMELLKISLPHHGRLTLDRVNFMLKMEICAATGALNPALIDPIKHLNTFRNRLAHNLHYELTEKDKQKIFDSFDKNSRLLILENGKKGQISTLEETPLSQVYKVIVVLLEISRQRYLEWTNKKKAAFENAKRVLGKFDGTTKI